MRTVFIKTLVELAKRDKRIFLITGDLGYSVLEEFMAELPERFLNVGVAEQNMVGMAAGFALTGKIPVVYSIATFASLRPYEFIRNDVCFQNLNVKIVGVGAGLSYPQYAATHQALDDLGAIRMLPNIVILNPGDPVEARLATRAALNHVGPVYLRLGKKGEPIIHKEEPDFAIGKGLVLKSGKDLTIVVTGGLLENAWQAAEILEQSGFEVRLISMPTVKPLDTELVKAAARETKAIFAVEENFAIGGLGTAIAEVLTDSDLPKVIFKGMGLPHQYPKEIGSQNYLRGIYGLLPDQLADRIKKSL